VRPPLLLSPSLGTTRAVWDPNVARLAERFAVIRYDHPGHGQEPPGPRSLEGFARAALAAADTAGAARFSFCGLSLGGMVGMWLAANTPERVERLVLACTAPFLPPAEQWLERAATVRAHGVEAVADAVVGRWFTERFADPEPWRRHLLATPTEGYARACEALAAMDLRGDLARIEAPTTVILGRHDPVVHDENRRLLAALGPVVTLEAAHLANVEQPDAFSDTVLAA
jgi:3-oxoadipate enol-lactonase